METPQHSIDSNGKGPGTGTTVSVVPSNARAQEYSTSESALESRDLHLYYGETHALKGIDLDMPARRITALIGPSGCGKSTFLRCFNRMNDMIPGARISKGRIRIEGVDIHAPTVDPIELRRRVGMVFQKSNPFPRTIFENVAYGPRILGRHKQSEIKETVERSLRRAALWEEVSDRLDDSAFGLSGGQQQRLCIARAIAVNPEIILMDEPCSALDPIATARVEELILELKEQYSIVVVTHNMQQASRISDRTAFFYLGEIAEYGPTSELFNNPKHEKTEAYISGRFG